MRNQATIEDLQPGDVLFTDIGGIVPGLFPVGVGQLTLFLTRRWWRHARTLRQWWRRRHVAIVATPTEGAPRIVQAMPRGCEVAAVDPAKHWTPNVIYVRPAYMPLNGARTRGEWVARAALRYRGVPYGFLTYGKLAAGAFRMRLTEGWLRRHLSTRRDMICSQLADQALADAGHHVFDDGRLPQDVVPAELFAALVAQPGEFLIPGHPVFGRWTPNGLLPERI